MGFLLASIALFACTDDGPITPPPLTFDAGPCVPVALPPDDLAAEREACRFGEGDGAETTLGIDDATRSALPISHVVVVMQENRSFDHYFGKLVEQGQPDSEPIPADFANPATDGSSVAPFHLPSTCLEADPPHQWDAMHAQYADGAMNGFVTSAAVEGSDGRYAMGYYDGSDLPFYYWLASTYALGDRHFADVLAGTGPNRNFLYAGSSYGVRETRVRPITEARTVFDQLEDAGVDYGVYSDGYPRTTDTLGWDLSHRGVGDFASFLRALADGSLPPVSFVDPTASQDEHPPNDVQGGEAWTRRVYTTATRSPLWPRLLIILTYDEAGGLFDHVPPPAACLPAPDQIGFDRYGFRVPLVLVSPWAKRGHVSHVRHSHASILRLIQLLHGLPALTARDAGSDALLDMLDFSCPPPTPNPLEAPPSGTGGCR